MCVQRNPLRSQFKVWEKNYFVLGLDIKTDEIFLSLYHIKYRFIETCLFNYDTMSGIFILLYRNSNHQDSWWIIHSHELQIKLTYIFLLLIFFHQKWFTRSCSFLGYKILRYLVHFEHLINWIDILLFQTTNETRFSFKWIKCRLDRSDKQQI